MNADTQLIIVAGGMGTRLGHPLPKALVPINGTPLIVRTLHAFQDSNLALSAIVVHPADFYDEFIQIIEAVFPTHTCTFVAGGEERSDSVAQGLASLSSNTTIVVIHDAARPFIQPSTIQEAIDVAKRDGAATVACGCTDTVLQVDSQGHLLDTPERSTLRLCQTPQVFRRGIIESAYKTAQPPKATDDASLVQHMGIPVTVVESSDSNFKITTPQDIEYAEFLIGKGVV